MITESEQKFCEFQYALTGSFYTLLIRAILQADIHNRQLLARAYPELVEVVNNFQNKIGYWEELEEKYHLKTQF